MKYYIDKDEDIWAWESNTSYFLYTKMNDGKYRNGGGHSICDDSYFKTVDEDYKLQEITEADLFLEML